MGQRAVEIIFKHKLLILLPILIIMPLMILETLQPKPKQWRVYSTIWVDQYAPLYQNNQLGATPAMNQAQLLNDFIHTRSFAHAVLSQTSMAPLVQNPETENGADLAFWRSVQVASTSTYFLSIVVTMPDQTLAYKTAQAIITQYQDTLSGRLDAQSKVSSSLYGSELAQAQDALTKSQAQLAAYVSAHPELKDTTTGVPPAALDGNFSLLQQQVTNDQQSYNTARQNYLNAQQSAAASQSAQPFAFTVVDQPQVPLGPVVASRLGLIKLPAVGLMLALMLSAAIAALLVLTNRAVLDPSDIEGVFAVPVLAEIPELGGRRWPGQGRQRDAVRLRLAAPARRAS